MRFDDIALIQMNNPTMVYIPVIYSRQLLRGDIVNRTMYCQENNGNVYHYVFVFTVL